MLKHRVAELVDRLVADGGRVTASALANQVGISRQAAHPDTRVASVSMAPDVEFMIRRATRADPARDPR